MAGGYSAKFGVHANPTLKIHNAMKSGAKNYIVIFFNIVRYAKLTGTQKLMLEMGFRSCVTTFLNFGRVYFFGP